MVPRTPNIALDDFRREAIAFLDANTRLTTDTDRPFRWGEGGDNVSLIDGRKRDRDGVVLAEAKAWARRRYDAGFGWIDGPVEYGGRGLSAAHNQVYQVAETSYDLPDQSCFTIGLRMVAPTIMTTANEQVKKVYLPRLYRGDTLACQLFSEPDAGSDLASVATRAERDGDEWVITGHKVWTSNAHLSDIGEIITRSDPDRPKHKGLTAFIVDMSSPGMDIRPLRQMSGGAGFNQVFLNGVRVPDSHRLGEVNGGWAVALTTLLNERAGGASGMSLGPGPGPFERLTTMLRHFERADDPILRQQLARLYAVQKVIGWTSGRGTVKMEAGQPPGAELSILKLLRANYLRELSDFVGRILGARLCADTGEWGTFAWAELVCTVPGTRIGGGTDEVLRNMLGERVLGLPKEPGTDSRTAFSELRR